MQCVVRLRKLPISGSLTVIHMCINYTSTSEMPGEFSLVNMISSRNFWRIFKNVAISMFIFHIYMHPCIILCLILFSGIKIVKCNYRKDSCKSLTVLFKFWAKNRRCGLYTRPFLSERVNGLVVITN